MPINIEDRKKIKCGDCGVTEGELHDFGCDMERCPFCGHQLITCRCSYKYLNFNFDQERINCGLPKDIYENGLPDEMIEKWFFLCDAKGRYPFIRYPQMCGLCGDKWPEFFMVETYEWKSVISRYDRDMIICKPCYEYIKDVTEKSRKYASA